MPFSNCIAIGVSDKEAAAARFTSCFEGSVTDQKGNWLELTAGPYRLYFVEDGTKDIAFSVNVPKDDEMAYVAHLATHGFLVDSELSDRVGEKFVRDLDGILVNLYPV